jgi:hypothetical protein
MTEQSSNWQLANQQLAISNPQSAASDQDNQQLGNSSPQFLEPIIKAAHPALPLSFAVVFPVPGSLFPVP